MGLYYRKKIGGFTVSASKRGPRVSAGKGCLLPIAGAAGALAVLLALAGCGEGTESTADVREREARVSEAMDGTPVPTRTTPEPEADASARVACDHWRNIVSDISKGLLTDEEIRTKVKEVYDSAWVSDSPGIAENAEALLRSVTMDDGEAFMEAIGDFTAACLDVGALD